MSPETRRKAGDTPLAHVYSTELHVAKAQDDAARIKGAQACADEDTTQSSKT